MLNVCFQCGLYRADKTIDIEKSIAICPECNYQHPFIQKPLLVVSGASGSGKTAVCNHLTGHIPQAVLLDSDILWRKDFNQPDSNHQDFFETWLRVCKNISQSGRPVVLFGAGIGVPDNLENCIERRYFSEIHYLALTCDNEILSSRLRQRPTWRGTKNQSYIEEHIRFNQWFLNYNQYKTKPTITILNTSTTSLKETTVSVTNWIHNILNHSTNHQSNL